MQLRSATTDDIAAVLQLWIDAESPPTVSDDEASVRDLIERDPVALIVADIDGAIVGSLIAGFDGWRAGMYRAAVHPDHRRSGIARALVAEGEQRLRDRGAKRITAMVLNDEENAQLFWTAVGYEPQTEIGRFVKNV